MTTLAERLKRTLLERNLTQNDLAEMVGTTQGAISNIVKGETQKPRNILEIANALGVDPNWLRNGGDMIVSHSTLENSQINNNQGQTVNNFFDSGSDELREMLQKQQVSLKTKPTEEWVFALDVNRLAETDIINAHFPRPFEALHLSQDGMMDLLKLRSTANVAMITMFNESMSPVINKKDLMFVDTTCKQYAGEGIYLFVMNNELYVRRLYQTPSGVLNAVAENERVGSSFEIDDLSRLNVLGRCVRKFSIIAEDL
ncbi:XRE family transcriptional regulator [Haemophilus haemolyticus]|uniref:XRE family transcriptional regulator n=1 Tax=Haemophilus haemolyticus TaxID=726 RepID=UPI0002F540D3|nr:XRE family transcriptional regulator [Haemophilus haemolyticus]NYA48861.1 helix-turn-helix transcriptional regulator [Haemophilus haemolyticus]